MRRYVVLVAALTLAGCGDRSVEEFKENPEQAREFLETECLIGPGEFDTKNQECVNALRASRAVERENVLAEIGVEAGCEDLANPTNRKDLRLLKSCNNRVSRDRTLEAIHGSGNSTGEGS